MALVQAVMQPDVISLSRDQTLSEAVATLAAHDISGAPVCDSSGRVLGVLSRTDLLERVMGPALEGSVEDAMMPMVFSIGPDDALDRAISIMAFEGIHRLIVVGEDGRLVGILTAMDVLRSLAGFGRHENRRRITVVPAGE